MQTFWVVFLVVIWFGWRMCALEFVRVVVRLHTDYRHEIYVYIFRLDESDLVVYPPNRYNLLQHNTYLSLFVSLFCHVPFPVWRDTRGQRQRMDERIEKTVTEKCVCQQIGSLWRQRASVTAQRLCNDGNDITNDSQIVTPLNIIIMRLLLRIQLNKVNSPTCTPSSPFTTRHCWFILLSWKYEKMTEEELFDWYVLMGHRISFTSSTPIHLARSHLPCCRFDSPIQSFHAFAWVCRFRSFQSPLLCQCWHFFFFFVQRKRK